MILAIDIGNTTIAFTGLNTDTPDFEVLFEEKISTETGRDLPAFMKEALEVLGRHGVRPVEGASSGIRRSAACENHEKDAAGAPSALTAAFAGGGLAGSAAPCGDPAAVTAVAISSVVPACTPAARSLAETICPVRPVVISWRCDTGLGFDQIPAPDKVGADRIADASMAAARYPLPVMTADLGTATTINVVSKDRQFLGGMIGSGVRTSLRALGTGTAQLPDLEPGVVPPGRLIGKDTAGCMLSAAVIGTASMIDGLASHVEEQLGSPLTLILTGGNASAVSGWIRHSYTYEPNLAAKGSALIALRETMASAGPEPAAGSGPASGFHKCFWRADVLSSDEVTEVPLESFSGIRIGQTEDIAGGTGITVVLSEDPMGMPAGMHTGGGGPATRETGILDPVAAAGRIHAAALGGGSAFGLDAAGGIMRYLEEKGIGVEVRGLRVPLVTQVDLFDLPLGDPAVRPDREMGYKACQLSEQGIRGNFRCGNFGAGCGAAIGKYAGGERAMKSGIGSCVLQLGGLLVGAVVAVNAFGDIYDWKTGQKIAGARAGDGRLYNAGEMISFLWNREKSSMMKEAEPRAAFNTTIGIVFTNAPFNKTELCKIAAMAHDGFARSIAPVHTSGDGDSIIALSVSGSDMIAAGTDTVGSLAAWAASEAILKGVRSARTAYGYPALNE